MVLRLNTSVLIIPSQRLKNSERKLAVLNQVAHSGGRSRQRSRRPSCLLPQDIICAQEVAALGADLHAFKFVPAISEPVTGQSWAREVGLITEVIERLSGNLRSAETYLCDPPTMVDSAIEVLKRKGMFSSRIRYDKFVSMANP